jgi:hypothetical protein
MSTKTTLNIGLVGSGFMGRTHLNAFAKVNQFFELDARRFSKRLAPAIWRPPRRSRETGATKLRDGLARSRSPAGHRSHRHR